MSYYFFIQLLISYLIDIQNYLQQNLSNSHLLLRKAAVSCLRQLSQREAKEVCEIAESFVNSPENINKDGK